MNCGFLILTLFICVSSIVAQSTQPCPSVSVEPSSASVDRSDQAIIFNARVKADDLLIERLKYKWITSAGTITTGQDTSSITVDIVGLGGQTITATVEVIGLKDSCSTASGTVSVIEEPLICGLASDQYGDIRFEDEKARLDNFAIQMLNQPSFRGAIIVHAGNPTYRGEAADRLRRAKNYLVKVRKIDPERLITVDAGYDTDLTTHLWIVPAGASAPALDSHVPIEEVRFTKRKPTTRDLRSTRARRGP